MTPPHEEGPSPEKNSERGARDTGALAFIVEVSGMDPEAAPTEEAAAQVIRADLDRSFSRLGASGVVTVSAAAKMERPSGDVHADFPLDDDEPGVVPHPHAEAITVCRRCWEVVGPEDEGACHCHLMQPPQIPDHRVYMLIGPHAPQIAGGSAYPLPPGVIVERLAAVLIEGHWYSVQSAEYTDGYLVMAVNSTPAETTFSGTERMVVDPVDISAYKVRVA